MCCTISFLRLSLHLFSAAINFGTPLDQETVLSSSPAGPAQLGSNAPPAKFGSVEADVKVNKEKVASTRSLDFNKMFQGTPSTPTKSTTTISNGSLGPDSANTSSLTPRNVSATTSTLRGSAASQRSFEPQRSPSAQAFHPMSAQSGAWPPQQQQQQQQPPQQQPRSPHLPHQSNMQPMPSMGAPPHWQQNQQQMYYSNMYHQPYGYNGIPQQQQQQHHQMNQQWVPNQPGYDGNQVQPRSPRHLPASAMGVHPGTPQQQSNGNLQPATPSSTATPGISSPAISQRSIPHTPTTSASSIASPQSQPAHQFGMGHPPGRGGAHYQGGPPSSAYSHTPSHSFGGGLNSMSPSAPQFEPAQKRMSSAIKIVNPETHAVFDLKAAARETSSPKPAPSTPTPTSGAAAVVASPSPVPKKATVSTPSITPSTSNTSNAAKIDTPESFMARVKAAAAAAESKKAKAAAAAAGLEREAAEKKAKAEADENAKQAEEERSKKAKADEEAAAEKRQADEKAAREKKAADELAVQKEAEKKEQEAREVAEAQEKASKKEAETKAVAEEKDRKEAEAKAVETAAEEAKAINSESEKKQALPTPIDTSIVVSEASLDAEDDAAPLSANKESPSTPFRNSAADVERMAREASSVPSTPLDGSGPRLPPTPRTPGTPGFANLPAKPLAMSTLNTPSNGMKLDGEALEKKKVRPTPSQLDLNSAAAKSTSTASDAIPPASVASAALGSARFIEDINKVSYPDKVQSPKAGLNESAEPGKFRYDREFLLQFMNVYKEKPIDLPPLAQIGMDSSQAAGIRGGPAGRRTSGMGPPATPGRAGSVGLGLGGGGGGGFGGAKAGGMGQFQHAPKTSEERFAQSTARGTVGTFGSSSGPMGSFNAGARSQPLSRTGSGSNAIPNRETMGSGIPSGGRASSRRGKDRRDPGSRNQVNPPEKGGPTIPMDQVVPLQASENRWMGGRGAAKPAEGPEMVTRKVKALLNKLTMEKFNSISSQILDWANKSVNEKDGQTLRLVIALIFEKATDEAAWSEMYALLCRRILEELDPNITDENLKTNDNRPVSGGHLFRKYLLNRCQEDFERGWAQRESTAAAAKGKEAEDAAKKAENDKAEEAAKEAEARGDKQDASAPKETELLSEEYYEAQKAKRRGLGLVRFIGELFKFAMITEKIMHVCIQKLLSNAQNPEEEEVESLCKLLTTVGKMLDAGAKPQYMTVYFQRIQDMLKTGTMNSRMKFMLQDVVDLRANGWTPRHDNSAPKTIAQIHEDAAKQKAQADADANARQFRGGGGGGIGGPMSRGGSRRGQQRDQYGPDGFITVGNQPAAPAHQTKAGNLSGFGKGLDRTGSGRPLSVGPQSVFAKKNQKSDDGSNPPSRTASSQNIFSLLSSTNEASGETVGQTEDATSSRPKLNLAKRTKPLPSQDGAGDDKKEDEEEGDKDVEEDLTDAQAVKKIDNDIKEFMEVKDIDEGLDALEALPPKRRAEFIAKIVDAAFNKTDKDVDLVGNLFEAAREKGLLDDDMVQEGLKEQVEYLDDLAIDVPAAFKYMAIIVVSSGLPEEKIEAMAETIQGEGLKPAKERFMEKVKEQQV